MINIRHSMELSFHLHAPISLPPGKKSPVKLVPSVPLFPVSKGSFYATNGTI